VRRRESAARRGGGTEAEEAESGEAATAAGGSEEEDTRKRRPLVIFLWRLRTLTKMKGPSILPTNLHFSRSSEKMRARPSIFFEGLRILGLCFAPVFGLGLQKRTFDEKDHLYE
jgi:hypothetical protein